MIIFFVILVGIWMALVLYCIRTLVARVLPDSYKVLKKSNSRPLRELKGLSGCIGRLGCKGVLRLDIYPDKLIVGVLGQALCLDYLSYSFEETSFLLFHGLKVWPVQIYKTKGFSLFGIFIWLLSFKDTTEIRIWLSKKDVALILDLVGQFRQHASH